MNPTEVFQEREKQHSTIYTLFNRKYNTLAVARIIVFLSFIVLMVIFANYRIGFGMGITLLIFPFVFGLIVRYHNRLAEARDLATFTALINQQETERLSGHFNHLDQGKEFEDKKHPYLNDLDIFGHNSVFQLVNRAVTPSGRSTLASWLSASASKEDIIMRQEALKELLPMLDWRQSFQAAGMQHTLSENEIYPLLHWINEPNRVLSNNFYRLISYLLPTITITLILLNIYTDLSVYYTIGLLAINGVVLKNFAQYAQNITEQTSKSIKTLRSYGRMIQKIESTDFESPKLKELQSAFVHDNFKASNSILKLQKILDYLHARSNLFYLFFNFLLLFDLHLVFWAEKWKAKQKADVNQWFDNIGELEAINSLAGLAYANPEYAMPEISDTPYSFATKKLGHPLIHKNERVANDLEMSGRGSINIITGSNMSGKSTFLRTLGVNAVLALAGGPVCASSLIVSRIQIFTSMRTEDSLEEHVSSFYAELKRIRMLLDMLKEETLPIMFMLDEILKGTNSQDRHAGAAALIRQVSDTASMGFVSTHDLELGQLTEELPNVKNYSFNSDVVGDEIIFNYHLEEGICHSFNASKLMEKIGIKISS